MKKVLITGATGFIGRHCVPILLKKNYEVHAVSSEAQVDDRSDVHWHQADLLESAQLSRLIGQVSPTHLLHFAWYTVPGRYWTSRENLRWLKASIELLGEFALSGGQRIVMAGSCAEYDWRYGYCSEKVTPLVPTSLYGVCKHALQKVLDSFANQEGLSAAWARIFFLYGPHEHPGRFVSSLIRSLLKGESAPCMHSNQIRDFLYVEDVSEAFVALLESNVLGAVNIASGSPIVLKDMLYRIAKQLNRENLIELQSLPVSESEPHLLVADVSRSTNELGWQPRFNLDKGLEQTIAWWKRHLDREKT